MFAAGYAALVDLTLLPYYWTTLLGHDECRISLLEN